MIPFLHLSASAESVTADIIDRMSDAMMSATEKLINFLIRFGIPITLLILLTVAAVRGIRALRRWQISKLRKAAAHNGEKTRRIRARHGVRRCRRRARVF